MSAISIRVVTTVEGLEALAETWEFLQGESADKKSIYNTYDWVLAWWVHFGRGKQLNILVFEREQRAVGILPLMRIEYRLGPVKRCVLETIGVLDCNHIGAVLPGNNEAVAAATVSYLEGELAGNVSALRLQIVPEDCGLLGPLREQVALSKSLAANETVTTVAPYIQLPSTWNEYYRSLSRNRRDIVRKLRNTMRKTGSVEVVTCKEEDLEPYLSRFFDLHQRRWQSVSGGRWFSDARTRAFYQDVTGRFARKGWLYFSCLSLDGGLAHGKLCYVYGGRLQSGLVARDLRYPKYSLGAFHTIHAIRYAIDNGLREFDLGRGDEAYKFHWAKSARRCLEVLVVRRSIRPGLRFRLIRALVLLHEVRENGIITSYRLRREKKRQKCLRKEMRLSP